MTIAGKIRLTYAMQVASAACAIAAAGFVLWGGSDYLVVTLNLVVIVVNAVLIFTQGAVRHRLRHLQ